MRASVVTILLALGMTGLPACSTAQRLDQVRVLPRATWAVPQAAASSSTSTVTPMVLSLALPGAGQHVLGQTRKWAYLAIEVAGWAFYLDRHGAGTDLRGQYHDFAWENGRIQSGSRVDGDFGYYETIEKWTRSGAFDHDAATAGIQPEPDPATYNGMIWERATELYLPGGPGVPVSDPSYQAALAYYGEHAYGTAFLWDWSASPAAQSTYADLIRESDNRFRQATTALGVVIANHLLSSADAYLSARGRSAALRIVPSDGAYGARWSTRLAITWGR
jgi:hypothetical protein